MAVSNHWALGLGAVAGLALALGSVLGLGPAVGGVPDGAVAVVGETPIPQQSLERAERALLADSSLTPEQARARALERLIDEELAVQHGLELGLATTDPRIRALLVEAVIDAVAARAEDEAPATEAELRAYYEAEKGRFSATRKVRVTGARFTGADADHQARALSQQWKVAVAAEQPLRAPEGKAVPVPNALMPVTKLRDYLGDTAARSVAALAAGELVVVEVEEATLVLAVTEARGGSPAPFEKVRDAVRTQWQRQRSEVALEAFFRERRERVSIVR